MKRTHIHVSLDNVGCLAVLVLTAAFHWALAARLGMSGFLAWLCALGVAFVVVAVIVGRRTAKTNETKRS